MGSLSCSIIVSAGDAAPRSPRHPTEPCGGSQRISLGCRGSWPWVPAWPSGMVLPMIRGEDRRTRCGARWVAPRVAHAWLPSPRNLLDMDTFSKSDPVVVLFVQGSGSSEWKEFGRTEVIDNTLNPDFVRKFVLDYYFEEKQNLRFDVYNVDSKSCSVLKQVSGARAGGTRGDAPVSCCGGAPRGHAPCGCCWGGTGASRRALTRSPSLHAPWGLAEGLPGAGVRGTGGGDRVPAGPPGESPHGGPREAVWDHPAAGRGAEQLPGHRHDAALCQQTGQEGLLWKIRPLPRLLPQQRGWHVSAGARRGGQGASVTLWRAPTLPCPRSFTICHKTEVVKNTLNPVWQPFTIPVRALCNGDYDRTVKIDVYDWDRDGSHDFIGEFATSYRELSRAQSQFTVYEVLNPRKKCKKKKYVNSGTVTLLSFSVESEFTFVDYIRGGTQLNFTVAIDFTASNGECSLCVLGAPRRRGRGASHGAGADGRCAAGMPSQPTSLHYASPYQLSAYALALKAVGEIIQDYDSDKLFPAYGFGAKLPPDGKISHQFPLVRHWVGGNAGGGGSNRLGCILPWHPAAGGHVPGTAVPLQAPIPVSQNNNVDNPSCAGIEGVLESYLQSLRTVQLYGPTNFAPVINQVAGAAAQVTDGSQYHVLLIITDGVISDMLQTKEAIVTVSAPSFTVSSPHVGCCPGCHPASAPQASALPMSIIIVGVGPAEFEAMEELDGDEVRVSSRGRYAERDIVQVTPAPSPVPPQARDAEPLADLRSRRVVPTGLQTSFPQSLCHFGITWMTRETRC
ncbi:copine-9 isoform 3-T3 [Morphnus guianensis]